MADKPSIYIAEYGRSCQGNLVTHRLTLVVTHSDSQTEITIPLAEPLPAGEEGDATLRQKLLALAHAIEEGAGSPQALSWHNRPRT